MHRLGVHSVVYLVLLVVAMSIIPLDSSFSGDAGAYGGQVFALRQRSWALDRPLPVVAAHHEGWLNTAITPDGPTPYTANPGYSLLLSGAVRVVHVQAEPDGSASDFALGLHVVPILSAVAAAAVAWHLARRFHPPSAPLAFWLLALGPTLVSATTLWAHTLSTALGGLALLAALHATDHPRPASARRRWRQFTSDSTLAPMAGFAVMVAALSGAAVVRSEAVFWIVAVSLVALVRAGAWDRRLGLAAAGALSCGVWAANRYWGRVLRADRLPIETSIEALSNPPGWFASRGPAALALFVDSPTGGIAPLMTIVAVAAAGAAVYLRLRVPAAGRGPTILLSLAVAAYGLRLVLEPGAPISGVIGAWTAMAVLAAAGIGAGDGAARRLWPLLATSGILVLLVTATQYASSGGLQWGGRYLSFAFVPMAAVAAVGGHQLFVERRPVILGLMLAPAVLGLSASYSLHVHHDQVIDQAAVGDAQVVVTESAALPRIAWRELPTAFYRATDDDVAQLLDQLAAADVRSVNVHGLAGAEVDGVAGYHVIQQIGPVRLLELQLPTG